MISREKAIMLRNMIVQASASLGDEDALEAVELFAPWRPDADYTKGDRVRLGDKLYRCLQDHAAQETWTPDEAPSLWAEILPGQDGTIGEWTQPDSTNPYMRGDRVTHSGKVWESAIDNNVWEPGAPGTEALWNEV